MTLALIAACVVCGSLLDMGPTPSVYDRADTAHAEPVLAPDGLIAACICGSTGHLTSYSTERSFRLLSDAASSRGNYSRLTDAELRAAHRIVRGETGGTYDPRLGITIRPKAVQGLFQQHSRHHGPASICPIEQTRWAHAYAGRRYGGWERAWSFWRRNRWW